MLTTSASLFITRRNPPVLLHPVVVHFPPAQALLRSVLPVARLQVLVVPHRLLLFQVPAHQVVFPAVVLALPLFQVAVPQAVFPPPVPVVRFRHLPLQVAFLQVVVLQVFHHLPLHLAQVAQAVHSQAAALALPHSVLHHHQARLVVVMK